ncbi:MAG: chemotaxis protein CheW [Xanthobacteraceae bacterium]
MSDVASSMAEFISFSIGEDRYGVDIMAVREIKGWTDVARLPNQPDYMRGVLNLRGAMVPIVDLRCRFGQGVTETTPLHVVIVVLIGDKLVGILADRVLDIVPFEREKIQPVPQVSRRTQADVLSGLISVDDGMIAVIALKNLVSAQDVAAETAQAA